MKISVLIIAYNRPKHLKKLLNSLFKADLAFVDNIVISVDGCCRKSYYERIQKVHKICDNFKDNMHFPVSVVKREFNYGLKTNIITSINEVLSINDAIIVLEDDLELHPLFFKYMTKNLIAYKDSRTIGHINGHNPVSLSENGELYMLLSTQMDCWGWATWKGKWCSFNSNPRELYRKIKISKEVINRFTLDGANTCLWQLRANLHWKRETWAVLWQASLTINGFSCLYPSHSLVRNKGMDGSGVNCIAQNFIKEDEILFVNYNEELIYNIKQSAMFDENLKRYLKLEKSSYLKKIANRLRCILYKVSPNRWTENR
jgi:glycosyltransferase involved in cell wall biosynthesis